MLEVRQGFWRGNTVIALISILVIVRILTVIKTIVTRLAIIQGSTWPSDDMSCGPI